MNTHTIRKMAALAVLLAAFTGCEKSDPVSAVPLPKPPSFSGNWTSVNSDINFSMSEVDGQLSGTCVYVGLSLAASGEQHYPEFSMRLDRRGFYPADFRGTFIHPDTVVGLLNGSGFVNANIKITRY